MSFGLLQPRVSKWAPSCCQAFWPFWLALQHTDSATIANGTETSSRPWRRAVASRRQKCALHERVRIATLHSPSIPNPATRRLLGQVHKFHAIHHTSDNWQYCHVGNTAQHCRLGLFQDSDFAGDLESQNQLREEILCILGS